MTEPVEEPMVPTEAKAEDTSKAGDTPKEVSGGGDKTDEIEDTKAEETQETRAAEKQAANETEAADEADAGGTAEAAGEETANELEATKEEHAGATRKKRSRTRQMDPLARESPEGRESKRPRKSSESFAPENFKTTPQKVTIFKGRGSLLEDIPNVKESIESYSTDSDDLAMAHKLLFPMRGRLGQDDIKSMKSRLLNFSGYLTPLIEGEDEDERANIDEKAETKMSIKAYTMSKQTLKRMCDVFDVDVSSEGDITKDELIDRLLNFLGEPDVKLTNASKKTNRNVKVKSPKQSKEQENSEDEAEEESSKEEEENKIPSDKALRKWVRAYVTCFNMKTATLKHALETVSDKFGVDLTPKKARIKELLIEEY